MIIDIHGHYTTAPPQLRAWRNKQIAEYSDRIVAFVSNPNKITSGTLSTLQYAEKMNKKSIIID